MPERVPGVYYPNVDEPERKLPEHAPAGRLLEPPPGWVSAAEARVRFGASGRALCEWRGRGAVRVLPGRGAVRGVLLLVLRGGFGEGVRYGERLARKNQKMIDLSG